MTKVRSGALLLFVFMAASWALADTLELKNGSVIKGTYVGGTETHVSFRVGSTVQQFAVVDVASLTFEGSRVPAPRGEGFAPRPKPSDEDRGLTHPTPPTYSNTVTIPTGTRLLVRTIDSVDSERNHVGDKFQASLDQPLYVGDLLVAPKGANVWGRLEEAKQSGQFAGKSELRLALTGIEIQGKTFAISTSDYDLAGKSRGSDTAKKTVGGAAVGAVIGAIAGGGKGAAVGAGVGAGAGTAVQAVTHGDHVRVPSETLLEFALDQPATVPVFAGQRD